MKLIVFYTLRLLDEINNSVIDEEHICSVCVPENLLKSEFKDYVYKNYYDKIFDLEKNCCGSFKLYSLKIDNVQLLVEI